MKYKNIHKGVFLSRPNRFIAKVIVDGQEETIHVKNTGRCKELLVDNATVYLEKSDNPNRKTRFDLIAVEKEVDNGKLLINMDSQISNDVAYEYLKSGVLFSGNAVIKREYTYKKSRFDFYVEDGEDKIFLEVKGVTLENDGVASFPDAPTERGVKHIYELIDAVRNGYKAYILFVIQMKGVKLFIPNDETHKEFGNALRVAADSGVNILAVDCIITENSIKIDKNVAVSL